MKIIVDAAIILEKEGEVGREVIEFEAIGSEAWIRMKIGSQTWDIDFRDFWNAARGVGIDASPI